MNRAVIIALIVLTAILLMGNPAQAQISQPFLPLPQQSVATTDDALATLVNPAGLGIRTGESFYLLAPYLTDGDFGDWGYAFGGEGMGFVGEFIRNEIDDDLNPRRNRYTWGFGFGDEGVYFGAAYSWTKGLDRQNSWDIGMLVRPYNFVSFGAVARGVNNPRIVNRSQNVGWDLGLAFRPLALFGPIGWDKGHRLTITADAYMREFDEIIGFQEEETYGDNIGYKFGASMEIVPGVIGHIDYLTEIEEGLLTGNDQLMGGMTFCFDHSEIGGYQQEGSGAGSSWLAFRKLNRNSLLVKPDKRFVEIKLSGPIVEYQQWVSIFNPRRYRSIHSFTTMLDRYAEDPAVAGILFKIEGFGAGFGKLQEMREAIVRFRETGKQVVIYMEGTGNGGYYLASAADKIYLAPTSSVDLTGIAAKMMFLRGTLDTIGIKPELEHIGDYKSASDMLTRRDMSPAQEEATSAILDDLFNCMVEGIADGRGFTPDEVRQLIDKGPFTSQEAYDEHLVDSLVYVDQLSDLVQELATTKKKPSVVNESAFNMQRRMARLDWDDSRRKTIAIVYALGSITSGSSSGGGLFGGESMGSNTIVKAIRQARGDDDVEAIVFRIDSPGGSG
ncbi:MAG: S49 family peptidase, partial [Candidatus Electryoneaceae bacterium]|nr:S49 family peptidase [Candidatus Electryoneaceae bacterium]